MKPFESSKEKDEGNKSTQPERPKFTPGRINTLRPNEVFVFGSNLKGMHGGGAARVARERFGARMGQGVGLQGQSYAIPTMQGGVETIRPYVDEFIDFARQHEELVFYVTRIGCGIAGFRDEEIAPLFAQAVGLDNVILPRSFFEIIARPIQTDPCTLTHAHGITKTLADVLVVLNEEKHFTCPEEAFAALKDYFERFRTSGDNIAFVAIRILYNELTEAKSAGLFREGVLDAEALRRRIFDFPSFVRVCDEAYLSYCKECVCNLIAYLNTFRHYTSVEQVRADLRKLEVTTFNHCGPNTEPYFFSLLYCSYPVWFFREGLREHWAELTSDGTLDNDKLMEVMFDRHERGIRKYGLEAVIKHDYESDGPCHPEVYFPKKVGTGPVYVEVAERRYARSCGEGKGPHSVPHESEFFLAAELLEEDERYQKVDYYAWVPKEDYSLPVFSWGMLSFDSDEEKRQYIEDALKTQD